MTLQFVVFFYTILINATGEIIIADGNDESCAGDEDCTINCGTVGNQTVGYNGYCASYVLNCPANIYSCIINCDGQYSCNEATINCPDDSNCIVNCNGTLSCLYSNIKCPTNSNCTIQCDGDSSCSQASIEWATSTTNGIGSISCNGRNACDGITFPPVDNNTEITIICDSYGECSHAIIKCAPHANCSVMCTADYSCDDAIVIWPLDSVYQSDLICTGSTNACRHTTPRLNIPNTEDFILNCNTKDQCRNYVINCPQDYGCFITCNSTSACWHMQIYWEETQSYNITCGLYQDACHSVNNIKSSDSTTPLVLNCSEYSTCAFSTIYCPIDADCTVVCSAIFSCSSVTLYAPTNHVLLLICEGGWACQYAKVHAINVSQLTIQGCNDGSDTCDGISVWFPPNVNGTKRAEFIGAGNSLADSMYWYAINGWLDIDIQNYSGTMYAGLGSSMYCGINYNWSCIMSSEQWFGGCGFCDDMIVTTDIPTTSVPTTSVPTFSPFTSVPTTSIPTTSVPTTSVPITSVPNTSIPTTSVPTAFTPTGIPNASISTKPNPTINPPNVNDILIFIIKASSTFIVILCIILVFVWYRKYKNNKMNDEIDTANHSDLNKNKVNNNRQNPDNDNDIIGKIDLQRDHIHVTNKHIIKMDDDDKQQENDLFIKTNVDTRNPQNDFEGHSPINYKSNDHIKKETLGNDDSFSHSSSDDHDGPIITFRTTPNGNDANNVRDLKHMKSGPILDNPNIIKTPNPDQIKQINKVNKLDLRNVDTEPLFDNPNIIKTPNPDRINQINKVKKLDLINVDTEPLLDNPNIIKTPNSDQIIQQINKLDLTNMESYAL